MQTVPAVCPTLPSPFSQLGKFLPARAWRLADPLLNRVFAAALEDDALAMLNRQEICLHVTDLGIRVGIRLRDEKLRVGKPTTADATISGPLATFVWLATRQADADTLFFHRHLAMEGDTELGLVIKNVIDATDLSGLPVALQGLLSALARLVPAQAPGSIDVRMPASPYQ